MKLTASEHYQAIHSALNKEWSESDESYKRLHQAYLEVIRGAAGLNILDLHRIADQIAKVKAERREEIEKLIA